MIKLTRLNNSTFLLNVLLIEQVEAFPDTTITLVNGKKIVVRESINDVMLMTNELYRTIGLASIYSNKDSEGS
ncbi:flagellar protein FlbD [Alkalihalophilus pseudofirmus]|uniref:flagellar FlbD family protein n=1 Tax=Alkalihalobacterium alkalinitrilicum TaxID=427920 RepID=UPI00094C2D26|nr:flagellar FlbD family protein [Alkalihalobacterium alkalinitrilicum]OLO40901.1 flagellar protein FlbD [Alkalihalophilus pseudofirmus]